MTTVQDESKTKRENVHHLRKITFRRFIYGQLMILLSKKFMFLYFNMPDDCCRTN